MRIQGWYGAAIFLPATLLWGQILGGAETFKFEAGDLVLYQENLAGAPIGRGVEGWEVVRGSYEVAEFEGRRWFRPLQADTRILYRLDLPRDFSVEFTRAQCLYVA